ncbi:MAG: coproporphyrinogen dehydrogenase HemZ [Clostridiales bacterium]|nr:coproporphyrinogen dehydrogenase HemZ [Clostridiales bacterium]
MNIIVRMNKKELEYDVFTLVRSFFPGSNVVTDEEKIIEAKTKTEEVPIHLEISVEVKQKDNEIIHIFTEILGGKSSDIDCSFSDIKEAKNEIKRQIYYLLKDYKGEELPWGILTGIRPTKLIVAKLEEKCTDDEIYEYMKQEYLATDEKIKLGLEISKRELKLLDKIDYVEGYSLYIGIPFCPSTCLYCSFTSYPVSMYKNKMDAYVDALIQEIEFSKEAFKDKKLNTVYFGGGTPTALSAEQLDRLLQKVRESFDFTWCQEFTVEAGRPDSITKEKLLVLKKHQVSRISINPQTMKQETLDIIGRHHTVNQVVETYNLARNLGFDNINMDFIVGLPDESIDDVKNTMEEVLKLNPDSITVHSLAIKRAARLNIFKDKYSEMTIENNMEIMKLCEEYARQMEMTPYYMYRQKNMAGNMENVGYARVDKAGIYNILIMEEKQTILALGAGAVTKYVFPEGGRIERVDNVKNVDIYIDKIQDMIEKKRNFLWEMLS